MTDGKVELTAEERRQRHIERHQLLHRCLDELAADFIQLTGKRPSQATILELMTWSAGQLENPSEVT